MSGTGQRNNRPVGPVESWVGVAVLLLLVIVVVGVWREQYDYEPAEFGLDTSLLARGKEQQRGASSRAGDILRRVVKELTGAEVEVESFGPENVYEKINGKDHLFLGHGFEALAVTRVAVEGGEDSFEMFVYDMGEPENAFGVYASLRTDDPAWRHEGVMGLAGANAIFFIKSKYYVCLVGSSTSAALQKLMDKAGGRLVELLGGEAASLWAIDVFPREGLVADSFGYVRANWLGSEFFDKVFTADYEVAGGKVTGYLSRRADADEGRATLAQLEGYWREVGGKIVSKKEDSKAPRVAAELFGVYEVAFGCGEYVGGVTEADDLTSAEALAGELIEAVRAYGDL